MAKVYITEFRGFLKGTSVPLEPSVADQQVAIGVQALQSQPFSPNTTVIRISSDAICSIAVGDPNTTRAQAGHRRVPANAPPEYVTVQPGQVLSVISNN